MSGRISIFFFHGPLYNSFKNSHTPNTVNLMWRGLMLQLISYKRQESHVFRLCNPVRRYVKFCMTFIVIISGSLSWML